VSLARDEILARLRFALADVPASERPDDVPVRREYRHFTDEDAEVLVDRLVDYRALVRWSDRDVLPATLAAALADRGARRIVVPAGLPAEWLAGADVELVRDDPPLDVHTLDQLDGVVTGCAVAVAATGTIILDGAPDQGRRALTLVPDYHLCVVRLDQVVGAVPEALARLDGVRPITMISGPSATSDIELSRVEGVHGPRTLEVVLVSA
jgi:L-lactate dehydrogenase complex protein LldG